MGYTTKRVKVRRHNRYIKQRAMVALSGIEIIRTTGEREMFRLIIPPHMQSTEYFFIQNFSTRANAVRYALDKLGLSV